MFVWVCLFICLFHVYVCVWLIVSFDQNILYKKEPLKKFFFSRLVSSLETEVYLCVRLLFLENPKSKNKMICITQLKGETTRPVFTHSQQWMECVAMRGCVFVCMCVCVRVKYKTVTLVCYHFCFLVASHKCCHQACVWFRLWPLR